MDFTWTDPNSASEWEISYGPAGFTAGAGTESVVTAPSASLSGLAGNTSYDVYVRAICAPGDTSSGAQCLRLPHCVIFQVHLSVSHLI